MKGRLVCSPSSSMMGCWSQKTMLGTLTSTVGNSSSSPSAVVITHHERTNWQREKVFGSAICWQHTPFRSNRPRTGMFWAHGSNPSRPALKRRVPRFPVEISFAPWTKKRSKVGNDKRYGRTLNRSAYRFSRHTKSSNESVRLNETHKGSKSASVVR